MKTNLLLRKLANTCDDFFDLFFPRLCIACSEPITYNETYICLSCQAHLPETDFHLSVKNPFTDRFDGRLPIQTAAALFFFTKKSKTQHLIHQIKYHDKREVAVLLGRYLGEKMAQQPHFQGLDYIIPVPMHDKKRRWRGFNQADSFADGLSDALQTPVEKSALKKIKMTESQTKKNSRLQRLQNTEDVFQLTNPDLLNNKNLLIVDDVMTSGATLESCALTILENAHEVNISFATIAFAKTN